MQQEIYRDIPRIYTAIAECLACAIYYWLLPRRRRFPAFAAATAVFLFLDIFWLDLTGGVNTVFWFPCMFIAIGGMYVYLFFILKISAASCFYTLLKTFMIAEFIAAFEWQLEFFYGSSLAGKWTAFLLVAAVYAAVAAAVILLEKGMTRDTGIYDLSAREIWPAALIVVSAFLMSNLSFVLRNTPFSGGMVTDIFTIRTLVDAIGLACLYGFQSHLYEQHAERELSKINAMLKAQYDHYRNYQETINLINIKYHDLKHQLAGLTAESDPQKRKEWLASMNSELESYRPQTQTGNQVLDGIIDQKLALMRQNKIRFTCVTDGALLSFMHVTDICTIFGNALDNAIESVIVLPDPDKRIVHLSVSARKQFVCIEVDNYCDHPVKIVNGFPATTKEDVRNHGFGVKSIAYTAEKYGGNVHFDVQDKNFELKVLIPR